MDLRAVIKLAASTPSRKTKSRRLRSREAPGRPRIDVVFLEAALASELITSSISVDVPMALNPFLDLAV